MLRRRRGAGDAIDDTDRELLAGVDAALPWHLLLLSASCSAAEAEERLARMLRTGYLEGTLGDEGPHPSLAPRAREHERPTIAPPHPATRTSSPPRAYSAGEALLRELRARRGGVSHPPPEHVTPLRERPASQPSPSPSSHPYAANVYSSHDERRLSALADELAQGAGIQRWAAARLREALEEERAGQYLQAVTILQVIATQLDDPRLRIERERVQAKLQKASSGVYRSQAIAAERALKHRLAAEHWRKVLEATPHDAEAALHAATCLMEAGDLKQAGHYARRAAELAPNSLPAHRLLLHFFRKSGMTASANRQREIVRKLMHR